MNSITIYVFQSHIQRIRIHSRELDNQENSHFYLFIFFFRNKNIRTNERNKTRNEKEKCVMRHFIILRLLLNLATKFKIIYFMKMKSWQSNKIQRKNYFL